MVNLAGTKCLCYVPSLAQNAHLQTSFHLLSYITRNLHIHTTVILERSTVELTSVSHRVCMRE